MRPALTTAYVVTLVLFCVGVIVQVFFAGLGMFGAKSFDTHETFGWMLHTLLIVTFLLAIAGPRSRFAILASLGLLVLVTVQIELVGTRDDAPGVAALHPVLAVISLGLAIHLVMRERRERAAAVATAAAAPAAPTAATP